MNVLITKLCYLDKEFYKYKENVEELGYIFIIKNKIYSGYNENPIILDYGSNRKKIEDKYKKNYISKIEIIKSIKSKYTEIIYKILLILLNEYRIVWDKNFFVNEIEVKKELEIVELHLKKDGLESYINYVLTRINKYDGNIINLKNKLKIKEKIPLECVGSIENLNEIKIKKDKGILELIKNYSSSIRKYGFMVLIESDLVKKYYKDNVSYLLASSEYKELVESIFISEYKIKSFRVYDYELCELMIKDKLGGVSISNGYYMCGYDRVDQVYEKIKEYYEKYSELENLKKAYLYDEYGIGKKVEEKKAEHIYDKQKSVCLRHTKMLEKNKLEEFNKDEFDEEKYYRMVLGEKEEIKEPIIRKSRYELVCERLDKKLK